MPNSPAPSPPATDDGPDDGDAARPRFRTLAALYRDIAQGEDEPRPGFSATMVPGEGPPHAAMMLVGEQPGDQEDLAARPFVGPAGRLLDSCLAQVGADRSALFLTNAVKRFKFVPRGKRRLHQTPTSGDIAHYRWWLKEEIRLVGPRVVVALGGTAFLALTGKRGLGAARGQLQPWEGRKLLPTVHPSYLLRLRTEPQRSEEKARFLHDLEIAVKAADLRR